MQFLNALENALSLTGGKIQFGLCIIGLGLFTIVIVYCIEIGDSAMLEPKAAMRSKNNFQKARTVLVLVLLALPVSHLQALGPANVVLQSSVSAVDAAPPAATAKVSKAFVSRQTLTSAETTAPLDFEIVLKMRSFPELQARVGRGERISRQEMAAKYEPLTADYQTVADWLTAQGLTITRQDSRHLVFFARGKVGRVAQALQVKFARVTANGKEYTSAVTAPSVPDRISSLLIGINGLQPHLQAHKNLLRQQAQPNASSGHQSYLPSQIAQAYGVTNLYNSQLTGSGQTIAIVIDTFPSTTDLLLFWKNCGVNQSINNIQFVQVVPGVLPGTSGEESLDVEWASSMAPGAHVRVYATTDLSNINLDKAYAQILDDVTNHPELGIHQMSMSYGEGESYTTSSQVNMDDELFVELAAAGVTPFASTGDGGSSPGPGAAGDRSGPTQVESPSSDPDVIAVGGTSLALDANNKISSESVWNNSTGATGGGTSIFFNAPSWQTDTGQPPGTKRTVPDISATADPNLGAVIYQNGAQSVVGGTSWSSPIWAAICALQNQARENIGLSPFGSGATAQALNPAFGFCLYGAFNSASYSSDFNDIISGGNGDFSAGPGYDLCTGIGTPNTQALTQTLTGSSTLVGVQMAPAMTSIKPGDNATFAVAVGGSSATYQWQRKTVGEPPQWTNLTDAAPYGGSATASLTVTSTTMAMSGDQFQCLVNLNGVVITSTPSVLVVETPLVISTLAGLPGATGDGTTPYFNYPSGVAIDGAGNIFVADFNSNSIREVSAITGAVSTPYGSLSSVTGATNASGNNATFNQPNSVAFDPAGNLYVADTTNNLIRKISTAGSVSTLAGTGGEFKLPAGVAVDSLGNVYVADTGNNVIREVSQAGVVTTLAGQVGTAGFADGNATNTALFNAPSAVAVDGSGNVYVADFGNCVVRKISGGVVSTVAGQAGVAGYLDGPGDVALFNEPIGLALDGSNNLYVTDSLVPEQLTSANGNSPATYTNAAGNDLLRKITPTGVVSTLAGQPGNEGTTDGTGSSVQFYSVQAVAVNSATGKLYLADTYNQTIRFGILTTVSIAATQPSAMVFGPTPGQFTVTRTGDTSNSLAVNYSIAGSAVAGTDYIPLSGTVTIPAGQTSAGVAVIPISDSSATSRPVVQLTLSAGSTYTLGSSVTAAVSIQEMTAFQTWETTYLTGETSNSGTGGSTSSPNGVPNLLEYAFNGNGSPSATDPLPVLSVVQANGSSYLALTFTMLNNDPNLTFTVQGTSDLSQLTDTWHTVGVFTSTSSNCSTLVSQTVNGNMTTLTVRDNTPFTPTTNRFIHVQVSGF
jgi:kumamolisin